MTEYKFRDITEALPTLMEAVLAGEEIGSRAGRVSEVLYPHIVLTEPWRREILNPARGASLPAQIAETMWLLAGRGDVAWLENYLPRAGEFSDDGKKWRGAYGPRIRMWETHDERGIVDQLENVVNLLKKEPATRRAVINIYDPAIDSADGKDIPCNNWIHFLSRLGKLHMHVTIRSNDLMWGWSGINAFEWSAIQEIVAGLAGQDVGELHFSVSSLHLYDRHWKKAQDIARSSGASGFASSPRFSAQDSGGTLESLDLLVDEWFRIEELIRTQGAERATVDYEITTFPEPMLQSWLWVIAWYWSEETSFLDPLTGTSLQAAALTSPRRPEADSVERPTPEPATVGDPFIEYVANLHAEKHAVYGDSWKKRGELGILGNIARKVDRIGQGGAGDTATDTVVDLLVYLVKYRLWLTDEKSAPSPVTGAYPWLLSDMAEPVTEMLHRIPKIAADTRFLSTSLPILRSLFVRLEAQVGNSIGSGLPGQIVTLVDEMIIEASFAARRMWLDEQPVSEGAAMDRFLGHA